MKSRVIGRDLVLLGGGHSHALALGMLAMRVAADTRITLVSESGFAPYSGMLPGLVAGHYAFYDAHVDLRKLCGTLGVRFLEASATAVDTSQREVHLQGRAPLSYDVLSINVGAQPDLDSVPGAREHAVPVKPVSNFWQRWLALEQRLQQDSGDLTGTAEIVVVGGGAGSVELGLAMQYRLGGCARVTLLCGGQLLEGYNRTAIASVRHACAKLGVEVTEQCRVTEVQPGAVRFTDGSSRRYTELVWCTGVVAADWLASSGLPCDARGFLRVDDTLQLEGLDGIFGAGDVAVQTQNPRPRAGVFAVRQAPVLARNLQACLQGTSLQAHRPQKRFLSLLSLGERLALADRGPWSATGGWVWRWKDYIDRKFMQRFLELPSAMPDAQDDAAALDLSQRCGGCGAKIPALTLRAVLDQLVQQYPDAVAAEQLQEDAAIVDWPEGEVLVQSVDTLRALVDDPWTMGRIAVLHSLSDIYAMAARPHSVLAHISLPYAAAGIQQRELHQLMSGVLYELQRAGCQLVGGHSMEGPELAVGITANGCVKAGAAIPKAISEEGQVLILTKPLGTGVVFAAAMENRCRGDAMAAALASMLQSSAGAAHLAREYGVSAATDITGFGLAGHLLEMVHDADLQIVLNVPAIPVLCGVEELQSSGIRSTLYPANMAALAGALEVPAEVAEENPILFDPQTSGGLVLSITESSATALLAALQAADYPAAIIGVVQPRPAGAAAIALSR